MKRVRSSAALISVATFLVSCAPSRPPCNSDAIYREAKHLIDTGEKEFSAGGFRESARITNEGLERLGISYAEGEREGDDPESIMIDDTGAKLPIATYYEMHGNYQSAARIRQSIAHIRLDAFAASHRCRR